MNKEKLYKILEFNKTHSKQIAYRKSLRNEAPKGGWGSFENSGWQR